MDLQWCAPMYELCFCAGHQGTSPNPVLHCVSDSLALDAAVRVTSFSVSGAPSSASSPVFHNAETLLYKFYMLGSNTKIWTDQRKTWLLVNSLSLLFQTPTSFVPITNFVSFGHGLTHCFSRFLTCATNTSCTLSVCWQWFWRTIRSATSCHNWKQRPDKWRRVTRHVYLSTRSIKNSLDGLSIDVLSPKSRLNTFLKIFIKHLLNDECCDP